MLDESLGVDDCHDYILVNKFTLLKKIYKVTFDKKKNLKWEQDSDTKGPITVPIENILAADFSHSENHSCCYREMIRYTDDEHKDLNFGDPHGLTKHTSLIVYYVRKSCNVKWAFESVTLSNPDALTVGLWVSAINTALEAFTTRTKRLLLFVNPFGGKRNGLKICESVVEPLLTACRVKVDVVTTQRPNHIKEVIAKLFQEDYDGIACVGGDGTFSEMINGLISSAARHIVDENSFDATLPKPKLRVGFIPAGSTNTIAYTLYGTADIITSVIYIILGDSIGVDVCSVHSETAFVSYFVSLISYGYLGDVIKDSEKFRWMGPKRYDFSGFKRFMSNQGYEGQIGLMKNTRLTSPGTKCVAHCERCSAENDIQEMTTTSMADWEYIRGKYLMVIGVNIPCSCDRSPNGISPTSHIGDGRLDVIIIRHSSLLNNLRLLLTLSSKNKQIYDLPFVEVYRTTEFTFQALPQQSGSSNSSVWNCDGELLLGKALRIKCHCKLLKLFYRSCDPLQNDENGKKCTCF